MRKWLEDSELLGDFGGPCRHSIKGSVTLNIDRSCSKERVVWRCTNEECEKFDQAGPLVCEVTLASRKNN